MPEQKPNPDIAPANEQMRAQIAGLRAQYAQTEEVWLTNTSWRAHRMGGVEGRPKSREELQLAMEKAYPDANIRLDYEHVVLGDAQVYTGREVAEQLDRLTPEELGESAAVYGKIKELSLK